MIVKTKDSRPAANKFEQAGYEAEEQMAFYLRRAFGDSAEVFVFNDLRLVDGDEVAQIDHLILHTWGMFIIESKSVSGEVTVDKHDEWVRKWGNQRTGMPSPIQQAKRQAELLRKLLSDNCEQLRRKYIFGMLQGRFRGCPIGICVAISDRGVINRKSVDPPEVCKADIVCERIKDEIERHRKGSTLLSRLRNTDQEHGWYAFDQQEIERIKEFLLARHTPQDAKPRATTPGSSSAARTASIAPTPARVVATRPAVPSSVPPTVNSASDLQALENAVCKYCGSDKLQATYGQHGYYFKCTACSKNTPMDFNCRSCGAKGRIRKQGPRFDRVCGCGVEELVWVNAPR